MKILFLYLVLFSFSSYMYAQNQRTYIIQVDTLMNLDGYKNSMHLIDINKIMNDKTHKLLFFKNLILQTKPSTFRKMLRHLSSEVKFLKTKRGLNFDVTKYQKQYVLVTSLKLDTNLIAKLINQNKHIKEIFEDPIIQKTNWPPNDQYYQQQIQLFSTSYNINLPRAWDYTSGNSGIKIGIFDDAVDYRHSDFGNGIGNGYRIRGGYDFFANDNDPKPDGTSDYHGTRVAGIIGALNNNYNGIIGIAGGWGSVSSGCQLFAFKLAGQGLGISYAAATEAIIEAASDPNLNNGFGYGIDVMNFSFGTYTFSFNPFGTDHQDFYYACVFAYLNNVFIAASRGNGGYSTPSFPADYSNGNILMSVSGVQNNGVISPNSDYGDGVSISAPYYSDKTTNINNGYSNFSGTSNAAPYVAGVGALIYSKFLERATSIFPEDAQHILKISAEPTSDPNKYGAGRLNAGQALHISSAPYFLLHKTADINKTVTTVANPSGNKITFYYPYGLYVVAETKRIKATYTIPSGFDLDSTWVWANSYCGGFEWGNPSYGTLNATMVSRSGRNVTFEMYCYKMGAVGSPGVSWYPADPNQAQIQVSILGKLSLSASISGPTSRSFNQDGTWTASVSGGVPSYHYHWYYRYPNNSYILSFPRPDLPPTGYWNSISIDSPNLTRHDQQTFQLKCVVTDAANTVVTSNILTVTIGGAKAAATKNNSTTKSLPKDYELMQNYPNPFNPSTVISYAIPEAAEVVICIYDELGRRVKELENNFEEAGYHNINFNASNLSSGIYFYRITAKSGDKILFSKTNEMILMK